MLKSGDICHPILKKHENTAKSYNKVEGQPKPHICIIETNLENERR